MPDPLLAALASTIQATRAAERDLFGALDAETLDRPIRPDDWSPKDFQAHLTAWKGRQAARFAAAREGRALPPALSGGEEDSINEELRAARSDWGWTAIVEEADRVAAALITEVRSADPDVVLATDRLLAGTFGNGVLHTLTHRRWLQEAGVPLDGARVQRFAEEALRLVDVESIPGKARAVGLYDLACFHALTGSENRARGLLRQAFSLDPELVAFSRTDADLSSLHDEIDSLASG